MPNLTRRKFTPCFLRFAIIAIAITAIVLSEPRSTESLETPDIIGELTASPLQGEEAIRYLKQQGTYSSLAAAVAAARYQTEWKDRPALAGLNGAHKASNPLELTFTQQQKLIASDGMAAVGFGVSVAISGDTVVVGAHADNIGLNPSQGSAYVFVRSGGSWIQQQKLTASDGEGGDNFGLSVGINGDTTIIGASEDDIGPNTNQGSAYVFVRSGGMWTQQQKLIASDGVAADGFGFSIAMNGDSVLIGRGGGLSQGSAYVFVRSGGVWTQQQKLTASDGAPGNLFGYAVAINGDTAVVGAFHDNIGLNTFQGSAYIFVRSGATWTQQQKLTASDGAARDLFGISVAITGDTAIVGAQLDDIGSNLDQGSAYVFVRSGTSWMQQQKLIASDGAAGDHFGAGASIGISGDIAVVGAISDDNEQGSAYVFMRSGAAWTEQQKLTASDGAAGDRFGYFIAMNSDTILVGADLDDIGPNLNQGSAYVFTSSSPVINSINPTSPPRSSTDQVVTVSGSNFQQGLTVGITFPSGAGTTLSGTQIFNVTLTSFDMLVTLNATGNWSIRVNNPDGGQSNTFNFTVGAGPLVSAISPPSPVASNTNQDITIIGSDIHPGATVALTPPTGAPITVSGRFIQQASGQPQGVASPSLIVPLPLNQSGFYLLQVINPPGGGLSNLFGFTVRAPVPAITNISPGTVTSDQTTTLIVTGSGFQTGFSAEYTTPNGRYVVLRAQTTFVNSGEVRVRVTMRGNPPYQATLKIINPDRQFATRNFNVTGPSVPRVGLSGNIGIRDNNDFWLLNNPTPGGGISRIEVRARPAGGNDICISSDPNPDCPSTNGSVSITDAYYSFNNLAPGQYTLTTKLEYKDTVTIGGQLNRSCDAGALTKISTLIEQAVDITSTETHDVEFKPPIVMVHGGLSCYDKWFNGNPNPSCDSPSKWDNCARSRGHITLTPNYEYAATSSDWPERADQVEMQIENNLRKLTTQIGQSRAHPFPQWFYIGHSMGGLVARVLARRNSDLVRELQKLYLLATPNSGSDSFPLPLNGLSETRIQGSFNRDHPDFGGKEVIVYAGTGDSYRGNPADGVVPLYSVESIYVKNCNAVINFLGLCLPFRAKSLPRHQTSNDRHKHEEIGSPITRQKLLEQWILPDIACELRGPCPSLSSGASPSTTPAQPPESALRIITSGTFPLTANQTGMVNFRIGATDLLRANAFLANGSATFSLISPSGQVIDFASLPPAAGERTLDEFGESFTLRNPASGMWTLSVTAGSMGANFSAVAMEQSPIGLDGFPTASNILTGQTVHLLGHWVGNAASVSSASMTAQVESEAGTVIETVTLFDDGNHQDGAAGDGVFGGDSSPLANPGLYTITFAGQGNFNGLGFARWAQSSVDVIASTRIFTGSFSDAAVDADANSTYEAIRVNVGISIPSAGNYLVTADLEDAQGYYINHGVGNLQTTTGGVYSVDIDFRMDGTTCGQYSVPFVIKNLAIRNAANLQLLDLWGQNVPTQAYDGTLFGCVTGTPAPRVASVQPGAMLPGSSGQALINGHSFANGAQISFGAGVTISSVTYASSNLLIAQVSVSSGATPGPRDVMVTNPDGRASTTSALFAVVTDQAPAVAVTYPANQQVVGGTLTVSASATDEVGIQRVEFLIDSALVGTDTSFPYQYVWNTNAYPNGPHTVTAKAYDTAGQMSMSQVTVIVSCIASLTSTHRSFAAAGGTANVNVTSATGCSWTATSNASWITIISVTSNEVTYSVAENTGATIREGTITIAGQTFRVYQGIPFNDVPTNYLFYNEIGKLSARRVTLGCGGGNYCPEQPVTREQMAAFIIRALGEFNPPPPPFQRFDDVPPTNIFYNFIDRLAVRQITLGCSANPPLYCPGQPVTREQMAAFIIRALGEFNPPTPTTQRFQDVPPSNIFYNFIDRMAVRGITFGCSANPPLYCPAAQVTRGQMAAFLVRAFGL